MKMITTFERFKMMTQKEYNKSQEQLITEIIIPIVTEFIIGYTGVDFEAEGREFPVAYEVVATRLITYHLTTQDGDVVSESMGNYSVTYGQNGVYPDHLLKGLHRRMRTPSLRIRGRQPKGRGDYEETTPKGLGTYDKTTYHETNDVVTPVVMSGISASVIIE